jgi:hypothetical protein
MGEDNGHPGIRRCSVLGENKPQMVISNMTCLLTTMKRLFGVLGTSAYPLTFGVFAISLTSEDSMVQTSKANRMRILMIIFSNDRNINTLPTFQDEGYQV